MPDWKEMLIRYMAVVLWHEGDHYLPSSDFSDDENKLLEQLIIPEAIRRSEPARSGANL